MKVYDYSRELVDLCRPIKIDNLEKHLQNTGWKRLDANIPYLKTRMIYQLFLNDGDFHQIDIPTNEKLSDYYSMLLTACYKLSEIENKDLKQIIFDLSNPEVDIIKFRKIENNVKDGTIPINDAISFYENIKKLITSAAMDIDSPTVYRKARATAIVDEFLEKCRFGQTEVGSYIVSLICPLDSSKHKQLTIEDIINNEDHIDTLSNSFSRKVVNKVVDSINIIRDTIDKNEDIEQLLNVQNENFVSINFMDNLANLGINSSDAELEVNIDWSQSAAKNRSKYNKVLITNNYYEKIYDIVKKYKTDADNNEISITGQVSQVGAEPDARKRSSGTATIVYLEKKTFSKKTIKVQLVGDDYDQAIEAHRYGKAVTVTGVKDGNKLSNCKFNVLD